MKSYSERLKFALEIRGLNQSDLARKIGVEPQSIQYLCKKGTRSVHNVKIASVLNISPKWLAEGLGDMLEPYPDSLCVEIKKLSHENRGVIEKIVHALISQQNQDRNQDQGIVTRR